MAVTSQNTRGSFHRPLLMRPTSPTPISSQPMSNERVMATISPVDVPSPWFNNAFSTVRNGSRVREPLCPPKSTYCAKSETAMSRPNEDADAAVNAAVLEEQEHPGGDGAADEDG